MSILRFFFHLRTVAKIKRCQFLHDLEVELHDLSTSQLDYCNALDMGADHAQINILQLAHNAAARLLTNTEMVTSLRSSLHFTSSPSVSALTLY